ncbi:hypothetical protein GCM10025867_34590 [Frondihabitans sucicola]|uniref:3-isopropylmalate dehydratase n=1 Tax=Frondihabitans sucicola TaxID=1268041 RepID=A0ABM8GRW6_9MICO|nr:hypothetical protein GCM10025867_34590 [Frondihabitans sucicola]
MPGITVVCGDSHTSTHGAFGAMAFGIGTSEVEHVLATQTLPLKPFKTMAITVEGELRPGVTAKDIILAVIAKIGTGGGQGYVLEYRGSAIRALSMEGRMTICNMSIEAGARAGMVAPDQTTYDYLEGKPHAPQGTEWDEAVAYWNTLPTDDDAVFDAEVYLDANELEPFVTWGTNPGQGVSLSETVPDPSAVADPNERAAAERALTYMDLVAGTPMKEIPVDAVFMGSCTNSRIEDLRAFASIVRGQKKADGVRVMVVPGSARVRIEAEAEGLDKVFTDFGAEWRFAGCSMCLGMNPDQLAPGSAAHRPRTATSRAARARAAARIWSLPSSQRRPPFAARCPARGTSRRRRPRPSRPSKGPCNAQDHHRHGPCRAPEAVERRHRPDHPGRVPQAGHQDRFRRRPVLRLAPRSRLRPQ